MFSGNPDSWQGAVDMLTSNSINLMNTIKELVKATEVVSATSKSEFMFMGILLGVQLVLRHPMNSYILLF